MAARDDLDLSRAAWRTSTYSGNGGQCVEVATAWRTSSHSGGNGNCVEIGADAEAQVLVRDTKDRHGRVLEFATEPWQRFIAQVKAGGAL